MLPKSRHPVEEAEIATRETLLKQEYRDYLSKNEDTRNPLTESEQRGVKKLQRRIAQGNITICQTDKSQRLVILSKEMWESLGNDHTSGDRIIDWEEVEEDLKLIKGHIRCVNHILRPGSNTGKEERVWAAKELISTVIPVMYPLVMDH